MNYRIDRKSKQPAYMQLYNQLRRDITGGAYLWGKRLPSKRVLADEAGVSVITVQHACDLLIDEGYIEAREKRLLCLLPGGRSYRSGGYRVCSSGSRSGGRKP